MTQSISGSAVNATFVENYAYDRVNRLATANGQDSGSVFALLPTVIAQCATSTNCSKTGLAMAILPSALGSSGRVVRILEEAGCAIHLEVQGAEGAYEVIANNQPRGVTPSSWKAPHMQGSGAGQFGGRKLFKEIREAARQFGREQWANEVVIQGGARTSGANPGRVPPPIRIRVR